MGTPERHSSAADRISAMSVPDRLSVDDNIGPRARKNSDLSTASDNVCLLFRNFQHFVRAVLLHATQK